MNSAVLLTGGWMHPPELSTALVDLLTNHVDSLSVVDSPNNIAAALAEPVDLLVVNACWFAMTDARYTPEQRTQHAVNLDIRASTAIEQALVRGTPLLAIHTAVLCFDGWQPWVEALGGAWDWSTSFHPPPAEMRIEPTQSNALLEEPFSIIDEEYQGLVVSPGSNVIAQTGNGHPVVWTNKRDPGRVAVTLLGHGPDSLANQAHQHMIERLIAWLTEETQG